MRLSRQTSQTGVPASSHADRSMHAVGLEFSMCYVRAVELDITGESVRILRRGMAPISIEWWDSIEEHTESFVHAVRLALSQAGITATHVYCALPRRLVTLKYARLPHAQPDQLYGLVQFEAQQYIPFSIDDVVLGHQTAIDDEEDMMGVLIAAARIALVEEFIKILDKAGLEVNHLSVSAMALGELPASYPMPFAIAHIDKGEMSLAVIKEGRILFTRATPLPIEQNDDPDMVAIIQETERSLSAFQFEHRNIALSKLILTGQSKYLQEITQYLKKNIDIPIEIINAPPFTNADPEALDYAIAIGLALLCRYSGAAKDRIDLIPPSRLEKIEARKKKQRSQLMVVGTAIILLFCGYMIQRQIVTSRADYISALHWNNSLKTAQSKVKDLKAKDDSLQKIYLAINAGSFSRPESVDILKTISAAIPSKKPVYLTQLACEHDGLITIRGNTTSNSAVTDIVLALQKSGIFSEAQIGFLGDLQNGIQRKTGTPASQNGLPGLSGSGSAPSAAADTQHVLNFLITCRLYLSQGTNMAGTTADNSSGTGEASQ